MTKKCYEFDYDTVPDRTVLVGLIIKAKEIRVFVPAFNGYAKLSKKEALLLSDMTHTVSAQMDWTGRLYIDSPL